MANKIDLWRYKEKLLLGENGFTELDNGQIIDNGAAITDATFETKYTFHCSQYRVSDRVIASVNGSDLENTLVVAVKHRPNFDYDTYTAKFRGKYYLVTYIVPDTSAIFTYDLLSLKSVVKNGGSSTSFGEDTTSSSSGGGFGGD